MPARNSAVEDTVRLNHAEPGICEEVLVLAVTTPNVNPMNEIGKLIAVSPEEDRIALLRAAKRDMSDPTKRDQWKRVLSSMQVRFKVLPDIKARFEHDVRTREKALSRARLVVRTCFGRIIEIYNFKVNMESNLQTTMTALELADSYRDNQSSGSEPVTDRYVDDAITVVSRILNCAHVDVAMLMVWFLNSTLNKVVQS